MASVCHTALWSLDSSQLDKGKLNVLIDQVRKGIPGLVELHFGANELTLYPTKSQTNHGGYTHALISRHYNAEHLAAYHENPDRIALINYLRKISTRPPIVIDFVSRSKL